MISLVQPTANLMSIRLRHEEESNRASVHSIFGSDMSLHCERVRLLDINDDTDGLLNIGYP